MAAITGIITTNQDAKRIRTASGVASGTFTDYVAVPSWAQYMIVYFNLTAVSTNATLQLGDVAPILLDDTNVMNLGGLASTAQTATGQVAFHVGPGVSGIADATNAATGNSTAKINCALPQIVQIKTVTSGAGTASFTITVAFRTNK